MNSSNYLNKLNLYRDQESEVQINEIKVMYIESDRAGTDHYKQVTFRGRIIAPNVKEL